MIYNVEVADSQDLGIELQGGELIISAVYNKAEDAVLIRSNRRALIYDVAAADFQDCGIALQEGELIISAVYNKAEDAVLIRSNRRVLIYDVAAADFQDCGIELQEGELIRSPVYNEAVNVLLIMPCRPTLVYDVRTGFLDDPGIGVQGTELVELGRAEDAVLVRTNRRVFTRPIPFKKSLRSLTLKQLKFLMQKVLPCWCSGCAYVVSKDDQEIYESLPERFQRPELFDAHMFKYEESAGGASSSSTGC